ncbi:MAG: hypothetical protein Q9191_001307 [Dirinaria sp. TL-2023a]
MATMSTTNTGLDEPVATLEAEWDEGRMSSSLDQLQNMHIQLRQLRETMPRLVEPLLAHHASPEDLYSNYSTSTLDTAKAIKALTKFMQEPSSQETLKKAKSSRATNPEGIQPWMVTEHPDWLEVRNLGADSDAVATDSSQHAGDDLPFPSADAISSAVEKFKANHPGIAVSELDSNRHSFEIHLPSPAYIHFRVETDLGHCNFAVTAKEKTKMHSSILTSVAARRHVSNVDDSLTEVRSIQS